MKKKGKFKNVGSTKVKKIEEAAPVSLSETKDMILDSSATLQNDSDNTKNDKKEVLVDKKKTRRPKQGKKERSKKYLAAREKVDVVQILNLDEAIEQVKQVSYSKFPGTIEAHIGTSIKNLRGLASLPFTSGKKLTILAFGKGAEQSGADLVGDEAALDNIKKGKINFDVLVTTPEWMPRLSAAAKVLGPRGLMPNPKNGTITEDLTKAVTELQSGKVEYRTEKDNFAIHLSVGKTTQPSEEIKANIQALYTTMGKSKFKKLTLAPTMGPGIKVSVSSI